MKKLLFFLSAICLTAVLSSCGGPKWNQERAQQLYDKEFEALTAEDFDEMLDLIDAGWEKAKKDSESKDENYTKTDEDREFGRLWMNLGSRAGPMSRATKRVVSDSQVEAYEALKEKIKQDMIEQNKKNNK